MVRIPRNNNETNGVWLDSERVDQINQNQFPLVEPNGFLLGVILDSAPDFIPSWIGSQIGESYIPTLSVSLEPV